MMMIIIICLAFGFKRNPFLIASYVSKREHFMAGRVMAMLLNVFNHSEAIKPLD